MRGVPLPRSFYQRPVLQVARDLLGRTLVRRGEPHGGEVPWMTGRIVEVEAYDGARDRACHASKGWTARTDPMFGEAGHAYVYLIYGMYSCLNVVTGPAGYPAAVLIRALEPIEGFDGPDGGRRHEASGPGRLCRALRITRALNRADLCLPGPLFIEDGEAVGRGGILRGPRIGVEYAGSWAAKPWRLGVRGSPALSRPFPAPDDRTRRRARRSGGAPRARGRVPQERT